MVMFGSGSAFRASRSGGPSARSVRPGGSRPIRPRRSAHRRRLGLCLLNPASVQADNGAGLYQGHHRSRQQKTAAQARRLGLAARLVLGRRARPRLPETDWRVDAKRRRHRRRLSLRQGGAAPPQRLPADRGGAAGARRGQGRARLHAHRRLRCRRRHPDPDGDPDCPDGTARRPGDAPHAACREQESADVPNALPTPAPLRRPCRWNREVR